MLVVMRPRRVARSLPALASGTVELLFGGARTPRQKRIWAGAAGGFATGLAPWSRAARPAPLRGEATRRLERLSKR